MSVSNAPTPTRPAASSERRPITVLFADIASSIAIAERLDPEPQGSEFESLSRSQPLRH
jgi:class 3 adenylate cyclase